MSGSLKMVLMIVLILAIAAMLVVLIANVLIERNFDKEALALVANSKPHPREIIQPGDLDGLPAPVQKWLQHSQVVGKEKIHTVRIKQVGRMRTEPGNPWMPITAEQYINVDKPGFVWLARVKVAPLINIIGHDKYYLGQGSMNISLLGLLSVGKAEPGREMNQGAMHRFMAEMIWYPSAALNDYITWEAIDDNSARAIMTWQGVRAEMVFNFNDEGDLVNNVAARYREDKGKFVLNDWGGVARQFREFNGIRIMSKTDIVWKYPSGDFNWLQVEVTDIDYNQRELY